MQAKIIDGRATAQKIVDDLKTEVASFSRKPTLAVVQVGDDPASSIYVNIKIKRCKEIGIQSLKYKFKEDYSQDELQDLVRKLNAQPEVNGILVQVPLPKHINENKILNEISPYKDVDGFHPQNIGQMILGTPNLISCTPQGIMMLLKHYAIDLQGKEAVVIGRSNIVGKPISFLLLNENCTVTMCHSKTRDLKFHTKRADLLIVAVGKASFVTKDMVKDGAIVVDVGTNRVENKLIGDVDFNSVKEIASYITPVPGGVGPMTVASLMKNTVQAYKTQEKK